MVLWPDRRTTVGLVVLLLLLLLLLVVVELVLTVVDEGVVVAVDVVKLLVVVFVVAEVVVEIEPSHTCKLADIQRCWSNTDPWSHSIPIENNRGTLRLLVAALHYGKEAGRSRAVPASSHLTYQYPTSTHPSR